MTNEITSANAWAHLRPALVKSALLFALFESQTSEASFTDDISIGNAKALALGHAVTADPPNIDSIHFNPAGLTRQQGRQMYLKGVYGIFSQEYIFGDYGDFQKNLIKEYASYTPEFVDENGELTQAGRDYYYDEALNTRSKLKGPTSMLPDGMSNPPLAGGVMGGASYTPPGSRFTFATNVYGPMMNGGYRAEGDPGRFAQQRGAFSMLAYFSPTVAYKISDEWQVGLSVGFNYSGMGLELPVRVPNEVLFFFGTPIIQDNLCNPDGTSVTDLFDVCGELKPYDTLTEMNFEVDQGLTFNYNLGLLWSPEPWLTFGLAYNSEIKAKMKGDYYFPILPGVRRLLDGLSSGTAFNTLVKVGDFLDYPIPTAEEIEKQGRGKLGVKYTFPQRLNAGVSVMVTPNWKVNFDVKWTEWSVFSDIALQFDGEVPLMQLGYTVDKVLAGGANGIKPDRVSFNFGLQDVLYWGLGTEYQYSRNLALRFGFQSRPSAVPTNRPNAYIPLNDANLISFGFGYETDSGSIFDFGIGYMQSKSHWPPCTSNLGNACDLSVMISPNYQGQDIKAEVSFTLFELTYSRHF